MITSDISYVTVVKCCMNVIMHDGNDDRHYNNVINDVIMNVRMHVSCPQIHPQDVDNFSVTQRVLWITWTTPRPITQRETSRSVVDSSRRGAPCTAHAVRSLSPRIPLAAAPDYAERRSA